MKNLIIVLFMAFIVSCASTTSIPAPDSVNSIIDNTKSSNENYIIANEWMIETFNNAESVIQFSDKEQGIIKGKYFLATYPVFKYGSQVGEDNLSAIITIRVRDNQTKIEIEPPLNGFVSSKALGQEYGYTPAMFKTDSQRLINSFSSRMTSTNTDW